ncbi:hypothetical protein WJX72_009995 [[Myrmecia] bisecta]|uniref:RRM domain-containing protein n=1 Tax=[Myrmecia] bisecta TaxID=41462 RepID=A0AAW1QG58_9CHLO
MRKEAGQYRIYMNVGYDLNEEQLRHYFEKFGRVKDVYLPKHPSGRNRGFGFTSFEDEDSLLRSLVTQEHIVEGRPVKTNRAGPRPTNHDSNGLPHPYDEPPPAAIPPLLPVPQQQLLHAALQPDPFALGFCSPPSALVGSGLAGNPGHGRGPRIYVGNIPDSLSEEEIRQHFMRWGQVKDIYFPGKRGQKRVNYCFITFDTAKSAQRACSESERSINGKGGLAINLAEQRSQAQPANSGGSSGPHSGHQSPISAVAGSLPAGEFSSLRMAGMQHPTPIAGYGDMYMAPGGPFPAGSAGMAQFGRGNGLPAQFTGAYNGGASHLGDGILAAASAGLWGSHGDPSGCSASGLSYGPQRGRGLIQGHRGFSPY